MACSFRLFSEDNYTRTLEPVKRDAHLCMVRLLICDQIPTCPIAICVIKTGQKFSFAERITTKRSTAYAISFILMERKMKLSSQAVDQILHVIATFDRERGIPHDYADLETVLRKTPFVISPTGELAI